MLFDSDCREHFAFSFSKVPLPGEKQDAAVHVDKVAEGVDVRAGHAAAAAVVQGDAGGQRQRHQQVSDCQVYGVNHRGRGASGGPAENKQSQTVEDDTNHQHRTVANLQQGGKDAARV